MQSRRDACPLMTSLSLSVAVRDCCRAALQPDAQPLGSVRGPSEALAQAAVLLETLERLLTAPFPAPAPLPAGGLLLLLTRILSMDDVAQSSGASVTMPTAGR